ncbi:hypothetical protein [Streptomyces echinatus]
MLVVQPCQRLVRTQQRILTPLLEREAGYLARLVPHLPPYGPYLA